MLVRCYGGVLNKPYTLSVNVLNAIFYVLECYYIFELKQTPRSTIVC